MTALCVCRHIHALSLVAPTHHIYQAMSSCQTANAEGQCQMRKLMTFAVFAW